MNQLCSSNQDFIYIRRHAPRIVVDYDLIKSGEAHIASATPLQILTEQSEIDAELPGESNFRK